MTWGAVLAALAKLAELVVGLFRDRALVQSGKTAQAAETQKETLDVVQEAAGTRNAVERELAVHPERLRDNDGFKRPD